MTCYRRMESYIS